jgi:hypothetical protein
MNQYIFADPNPAIQQKYAISELLKITDRPKTIAGNGFAEQRKPLGHHRKINITLI